MKRSSSQAKVKSKGACENKSQMLDHLQFYFISKPKVKSSSQTNPFGFRVWGLQLGIDPTYSWGLAKLQLPLIILLFTAFSSLFLSKY
jgi:hypothetical protein